VIKLIYGEKMLSLAIRKQVKSNNINLSGLKPFIGKNVIITITEEYNESQKMEQFSDFFNLAGHIFLDQDSINELRESSIL
jgi:hypothetical protein